MHDDDLPPARKPPPLPIDDGPPRRRRPRPLPAEDIEDDEPNSPKEGPESLWMILKYVAFGVGMLMAFQAAQAPAVQAGAWAGLACFCAVGARLAQAEQHRFPPKP